MKKKNKLHLSDLLTGLMYTVIFVGTICYLMSCTSIKAGNDLNRVIKKATDDRGFTSIVFITNSNDTFALDYLTPKEYRAIKQPHTYETDDKFFNGQILLPDYVHPDTLIVTDARFINWCMVKYDAASDGDIADILKAGTRKYSRPVHYQITCLNDTIFNY